MKKNLVLAALLLPLALSVSAEEGERGKEVFTTICMTCHKFDRSPDMIAPPIFGVKNHYLNVHSNRDDFIMSLSSWLETQDVEKSLMLGAVRRFNVMPPVELSERDRDAVAAFIYDADFTEPSWYAEHFQKAHGVK
ncbi:MAG: c-type cytochrome [Sedimenticola sp.]